MKDHRPWHGIQLPVSRTEIPGMLAPEECEYMYWLTSTQYDGEGAIVDLGCWLGQSTACLAAGLERSGRPGQVIAFDLFQWEPSYMRNVLALDLPAGASFRPEFERLTARWASRIDARTQDLGNYRWTGGEIALLVVDAAKTWALTNSILRGFGDALVPGKTRIVFQDFRFHDCHWLPLVIGSRPDLWTLVESTTSAWTATYRLNRPLLAAGGMDQDYREDSFGWQQAHELFASLVESTPAPAKRLLRLGWLRKLLIEGREQEAAAVRAQITADVVWPTAAADIEAAENVLAAMVPIGWGALGAGDLATARAVVERCRPRHAEAPPLLQLAAMCALRSGDLAEAAQLATRLRAADPDGQVWRAIHCEVALAERRIDDVERLLGELDGDDAEPESLQPWFRVLRSRAAMQRALAAAGTCDREQAIAFAHRAASFDPTTAWPWIVIAQCELARGRPDQAEAAVAAAVARGAATRPLRLMQIDIDLRRGRITDPTEPVLGWLAESSQPEEVEFDDALRILDSYWRHQRQTAAEPTLTRLARDWNDSATIRVWLARARQRLQDGPGRRAAVAAAIARRPELQGELEREFGA